MKDLVDQIGQLFLIGFEGDRPSAAVLDFLSEEQIGGVILFEDNCPTHQDTRENINAIKARYPDRPPLIAVDQEGGRVCRIKGAPIEFRSPADYGRLGDVTHFGEDYGRAAVALSSLGINVNLAPVCDLFLDANNECLEGRCFGDRPDSVIPFVKEAVSRAKGAGLLSCLKHFPGLGASVQDPHHETPQVDYDSIVWQQREKTVFAAGLDAGADMLMTTHLKAPKFDNTIVTGSRKIISSVIRNGLNFDGPIVTDDLTMKGADELGHIGERSVKAFVAGHDILLFGPGSDLAMEAFDYFRESFLRGEIDPIRVQSALQRISGMKFKLDSMTVR